jgi:hypothetical protein
VPLGNLCLAHRAACPIAHCFPFSTACLLVDCKAQVFDAISLTGNKSPQGHLRKACP